jgi:cell division protein FtsZ
MSAEQQSGLLLLGVGGGGCRLAASVLAAHGGRMRALGVDTDALSNRHASEGGLACLLLGGARLAGHGTGGDAIKGRLAAQDDIQNLVPHLQGVRTVVLTACLGAGTGGGATPEIIKALHDIGIATICFVTTPFGFEGESRSKAAERVLPMIEENADTLVTVALDDLFGGAGDARLEEAIRQAEAVVASGITLLWRLVTTPGFIQTDPERLHALVVRGGNACFGCGSAQGDERAARVVSELRGSRLLRSGAALSKANAVLVGILSGPDLRLAEIGEIMGKLRGVCKAECQIEMGTVLDGAFEGRLDVVVLAFENCAASFSAEGRKEVEPLTEPPVAETFPIHPGSARKGREKKPSKLSFGTTGRGKFQNVDPTFFDGQDLDIPTFVRRGILLER